MKVRASPHHSPLYRQQCDDLWEPWEYRCDACGARCEWGEDLCNAHRVEPSAPPPYPWCLTPHNCSRLGYCPRDPNCGE